MMNIDPVLGLVLFSVSMAIILSIIGVWAVYMDRRDTEAMRARAHSAKPHPT